MLLKTLSVAVVLFGTCALKAAESEGAFNLARPCCLPDFQNKTLQVVGNWTEDGSLVDVGHKDFALLKGFYDYMESEKQNTNVSVLKKEKAYLDSFPKHLNLDKNYLKNIYKAHKFLRDYASLTKVGPSSLLADGKNSYETPQEKISYFKFQKPQDFENFLDSLGNLIEYLNKNGECEQDTKIASMLEDFYNILFEQQDKNPVSARNPLLSSIPEIAKNDPKVYIQNSKEEQVLKT